MRRLATTFFALLLGASFAQSSAPKPMKSLDTTAMDTNVNPCVDFYEYSCGNWRRNNPLPPDKARFGRFDELQDRNRDILRILLEKAADPKAKRTAMEQQYGDYYAACMDVETANKRGILPIKGELNKIDGISTKQELIDHIAYMHNQGLPAIMGFGVGVDLADTNKHIVNAGQGGLGLPNRDFYFKQDGRNPLIREKYVEHMTNMFKLAGDAPEKAAAQAKRIMEIETALAEGHLDPVELRNPKNRDNRTQLADFYKMTSNLGLERYVQNTGLGQFTELNLVSPKFFQNLNAKFDTIPVEDWKTYLRWRVINSTAALLSKDFDEESFNFFGKFINGQQQQQDRWKRCVARTDADLGQVLGQAYVKQYFGEDGKARMMKLINALERAMEKDIKGLDWMTDETKAKALKKLSTFAKMIGYPDNWKDYSSVKTSRTDAIGNSWAVNKFERKFNLNKLGKPVDKKEWGFTAPTVNASYSPQRNTITFPAGILQPPFFDRTIDDAVNFGAIGGVIGHEISHGFDDQGSQFDADGALRNWWSDVDRKEFEKRTSCLVNQYNGYVSVKHPTDPSKNVYHNGKLTLGENVGDLAGTRIAYMALMDTIAEEAKSKKIDGFTPQQRFFIAWAQVWCQNITDQAAEQRAKTDPHSLGQYRTNGIVSNMPEFQEAFSCKKGDPMVRENQCRVW